MSVYSGQPVCSNLPYTREKEVLRMRAGGEIGKVSPGEITCICSMVMLLLLITYYISVASRRDSVER